MLSNISLLYIEINRMIKSEGLYKRSLNKIKDI
jgi:hypothetical protein